MPINNTNTNSQKAPNLSSVSSLRTYVDPSRAIFSPSDCEVGQNDYFPNNDAQQSIFPATGLFSNIAFSNFYTSTDESDIEAALVTARR